MIEQKLNEISNRLNFKEDTPDCAVRVVSGPDKGPSPIEVFADTCTSTCWYGCRPSMVKTLVKLLSTSVSELPFSKAT